MVMEKSPHPNRHNAFAAETIFYSRKTHKSFSGRFFETIYLGIFHGLDLTTQVTYLVLCTVILNPAKAVLEFLNTHFQIRRNQFRAQICMHSRICCGLALSKISSAILIGNRNALAAEQKTLRKRFHHTNLMIVDRESNLYRHRRTLNFHFMEKENNC